MATDGARQWEERRLPSRRYPIHTLLLLVLTRKMKPRPVGAADRTRIRIPYIRIHIRVLDVLMRVMYNTGK